MAKNKFQSGSAHLIVIIVLVTAILGLLGFVFWQNFMQPKTVNTVNGNTTGNTTTGNKAAADPTQVALAEIASDQSLGSNLAIKYPSLWTLAHSDAENVGSQEAVQLPDTNTITSPDGAISVELKVGISGVGGTCPPTDDSTPKVLFIETSTIDNFPSLHLVSFAFYTNSVYRYAINVIRNNEMSVKVGDAVECSFGFFQTIQGDTASLTIKLNNVENNTATTLQDFRLAIASDNFQVAKRIVQSLYVK